MALGYCAACDTLRSIVPGAAIAEGARARHWYPVPHDDPDGKPCPGDKKAIPNAPRETLR